jgi:hypothetical protein
MWNIHFWSQPCKSEVTRIAREDRRMTWFLTKVSKFGEIWPGPNLKLGLVSDYNCSIWTITTLKLWGCQLIGFFYNLIVFGVSTDVSLWCFGSDYGRCYNIFVRLDIVYPKLLYVLERFLTQVLVLWYMLTGREASYNTLTIVCDLFCLVPMIDNVGPCSSKFKEQEADHQTVRGWTQARYLYRRRNIDAA